MRGRFITFEGIDGAGKAPRLTSLRKRSEREVWKLFAHVSRVVRP